jgi:hypothetical protein
MTDWMGFLLLDCGITISSLLQHFCAGSVRKGSVAYAGSDFSFFLLYQYFMASQVVSRVMELRHGEMLRLI